MITLEKQRSEKHINEYYRKREIIILDNNLTTDIKAGLICRLTNKYFPLRDPENDKYDLELLKEYKPFRPHCP